MTDRLHRRERPFSGCEALEVRAYAAKISYGSDDSLYDRILGIPHQPLTIQGLTIEAQAQDRLTPATVVRTLEESRADPDGDLVTPYLDKQGTLYLHGTFGDDTFDIRPVAGGVIRVNYVSIQNRTELKSDLDAQPAQTRPHYTTVQGSPDLAITTTSTWNTFDLHAKDVRRIVIDGQAGRDVVRSTGLSFVPVTYDVESAKVVRNGAAAGATPSDPITGHKWGPHSYWGKLAAQQQAEADASDANVAFFGDSHAARFATVGGASFRHTFPNALDLGIAGDSTRQMLARVQARLFDTFKPKALVLFAGTNNFKDPKTDGTDAQILDGMNALIAALRAKLPKTQLIVVGLLPRADAAQSARTELLNSELSEASAATRDFDFYDIYPHFVRSHLAASAATIGADSHYTARGYQILAKQLDDLLVEKERRR